MIAFWLMSEIEPKLGLVKTDTRGTTIIYRFLGWHTIIGIVLLIEFVILIIIGILFYYFGKYRKQ